MSNDTLFRLVSTGVEIDNRIRQGTAVQIQHYASKSFLVLEQAKFTTSEEKPVNFNQIDDNQKSDGNAAEEKEEDRTQLSIPEVI